MKFITKEPILKGWSNDKKYCVTDKNGIRYLLRISDLTEEDAKEAEFHMMEQVAALGIPMCLPIEFGVCQEGVYSIQSWIDGQDAETVIPAFSEKAQYDYGFQAGQFLRKIHSIPAPKALESWGSRFGWKMDFKIKRYRECPLKYEHGQAFLDYMEANRHLLKNRPQVFQHGDFHRGNLMIGKDGRLYVIDFNRRDFGDPWEDLKAIAWDVEMSHAFARGRIDGYFNNQIPEDFWPTLALYIACGIISSLPWAIPFGEMEVENMRRQAKDALEWYENMTNPVPTWYQEG